MHEGAWSSRLGIAGQPALAEEAMLARDLALVRLTGAPMHFLHLSTAGSIEMIRSAKAEGLAVTAEVTPHHLALCDAAVAGFDPVYKVNPPLRTASDVAATRAGVRNGIVDAIATDHAPHAPERKDEPFDEAPAGHARSRDRARRRLQRSLRGAPESEDGADPGWVARGGSDGDVDAGPLRPVLLAAGPYRGARPGRAGAPGQVSAARAARSGQEGPRTSRCSTRASNGWWTRANWPAGAATRPTRDAASPARSATRCSQARSSSETARRSGE